MMPRNKEPESDEQDDDAVAKGLAGDMKDARILATELFGGDPTRDMVLGVFERVTSMSDDMDDQRDMFDDMKRAHVVAGQVEAAAFSDISAGKCDLTFLMYDLMFCDEED